MADNLKFDKNNKKDPILKGKQKKANKFLAPIFMLLAVLFFLGLIAEQYEKGMQIKTTYSEFFDMVAQNRQTQKIASVELGEGVADVALSDGKAFSVNIPMADDDLIRALRENVSNFTIKQSNLMWLNIN